MNVVTGDSLGDCHRAGSAGKLVDAVVVSSPTATTPPSRGTGGMVNRCVSSRVVLPGLTHWLLTASEGGSGAICVPRRFRAMRQRPGALGEIGLTSDTTSVLPVAPG